MLQKDKILCFTDSIDYSVPLLEGAAMIYNLERFVNPFEVGLKPFIAADRKISILSREKLGFHKAHINLYLETDTVLLHRYGKKYPAISFNDFLKGDGFNEEIATLLQTTKIELNSSINKIILNKEVLDNLNKDYLNLIFQSSRKEDFYLGGTH